MSLKQISSAIPKTTENCPKSFVKKTFDIPPSETLLLVALAGDPGRLFNIPRFTTDGLKTNYIDEDSARRNWSSKHFDTNVENKEMTFAWVQAQGLQQLL